MSVYAALKLARKLVHRTSSALLMGFMALLTLSLVSATLSLTQSLTMGPLMYESAVITCLYGSVNKLWVLFISHKISNSCKKSLLLVFVPSNISGVFPFNRPVAAILLATGAGCAGGGVGGGCGT